MFKSYKDLEIYKKAHKLAIEIHEMTLALPKFEMYEEGSQIRRSSKSVKTNIVEGFGRRRYKQEFIKFLTYSLASCDETLDHLGSIYATKSLKNREKYEYFCEEYDHLGRMISNFTKSVDSGHKSKINIENRRSRIENPVKGKD
ncbi:four helix bundle protein [candidate division WOR-3 bacterium]|nr:four helix bundle protein [candidate division WOR-3 bacterium]